MIIIHTLNKERCPHFTFRYPLLLVVFSVYTFSFQQLKSAVVVVVVVISYFSIATQSYFRRKIRYLLRRSNYVCNKCRRKEKKHLFVQKILQSRLKLFTLVEWAKQSLLIFDSILFKICAMQKGSNLSKMIN